MTPAAARPPARPPELPGYTFVEFLASGGYADVFLYEQEFPRQRVAVKVLKRIDRSMDSDFVNEANRLAGLSDHPNIVRIYGASVSPDGRAYMVMEYCPPPHLGARSRPNGLPIEEALRVGVKIAGAVEAAHRSGVLHRDIKPTNILLRANNEPVLIDFGIAGERQGDVLDEGAGVSIPYAPPEVVFEDAPGDELADVYSLAATVYALVAGRSPYEVTDGNNGQEALIMRMRANNIPPTRRDGVSEALEHLFSYAMARAPRNRPQSAAAFAHAIQEIERQLGYRPTDFFAGSSERNYQPVARDAQDEDGTRSQVQVVSPEPPSGLISPMRSATPAAPRVSQGSRSEALEAPDALTGRRGVPTEPMSEPITRARQRVATAPPIELDDDRPKTSRALLAVAGVVVALACIAFIVSSLNGGDGGGAEPPVTTVGPTLPTAPAPVENLLAARTGNDVKVTWTYDGQDGETFLVEIDGTNISKVVDEPEFTLTNAPAGRVCVTVKSGLPGGSYSDARPACTK